MKAEQEQQNSSHIGHEKWLTLVHALTAGAQGHEDDERPLPLGPWDPVIRIALERIRAFGPAPDPWNIFFTSILARHPEIWDAVGGGQSLISEVALNPQPLPPRFAFLISVVQEVTSRAELMQEMITATKREDQPQGTTAPGRYLSRFTEDICGNDFRFRWPFPRPRPHWFTKELNGIDLVITAAQFDQGAKEAFSQELQQQLKQASAKIAEAGLSKMQ